jgi:hypothetical protein
MSSIPENNDNLENNICIKCGMCCDGTLFTFANIEKDEKLHPLFEAEIITINQSEKTGFSQPCAYLNDCVCSIYNSEKIKRPLVCGKFKCKLLVKYQASQINYNDAIALIEKTKDLAAKQNNLLSNTWPELSKLSTAKKIKELKNMLEKSEDKTQFRKQFGQLLLSTFTFETYLKKHFMADNKKKNKA